MPERKKHVHDLQQESNSGVKLMQRRYLHLLLTGSLTLVGMVQYKQMQTHVLVIMPPHKREGWREIAQTSVSMQHTWRA